MSSVFPHHPSVEHAPQERTNITVGTDDPTDLLQVLSSDTAQDILGALTSEPKTASDIATTVGQSIQNITYHLDRLCEVNLVTSVGTWYSEKGREMTVYALTTEELVVRFSDSTE